jgi:amino acid adenylation domain-containing protein
LELAAEYSADLFEPATVDRMLAHFSALLDAALADPDRGIDELTMLSEEERSAAVADPPALVPLQHRCLHPLIEERARQQPDALAVVADEALSYAELGARAERWARRLRALGVGPDVLVGLCVARSTRALVGILAVLKAGGAWVPLDPEYPSERLAFMVADSGVRIVLTEASSLARLPSQVAQLERLDEEPPEAPNVRAKPPLPQHLAYVIYTSGSTGAPKGIAITHGGVTANLVDLAARFSLGPGDRVLAASSLSFDMSIFELLGTLLAGASVILPDARTLYDGRLLAERLIGERVTVWSSVPTALDETLVHVTGRLDRLRLAVLGGERIPATLPGRLAGVAPRVAIANIGGATEASVCSTLHLLARPGDGGAVPYGRPLSHQRTYVLDARLQAVPVGVVGELYLAGVGLARGYLHRPALTAERFVPDPFHPGERMYRTGDLARVRSDGELELLGRTDQQVKLRGLRIELGEIEAALSRLDGVRDSAVMIRDDGDGAQLFAYVAGDQRDAGSLRARLREKLPDYMLPRIVFLDRLPRTPNRKLDRQALPPPDRGDRQERFVAPRSETERVLARLWADLLKVKWVGVEDDFFELGGHSLLAARIVSCLRERFGVDLPLRVLFENPTVASSAAAVDRLTAGGARPPRIVRRADRETIALSFNQERALHAHVAAGGVGQLIRLPLQILGPLDEPALERALIEILRRHEVLRSRFRPSGSGWQVSLGPLESPLARIDLRSDAEPERRALERSAALESEPWDLARSPQLRVELMRLGSDRALLSMVVHHAVWDAASTELFAAELVALHESFRQRRPANLPPLAFQYADFAAWQRSFATSTEGAEQMAWWQRQLDGALAPRLPCDFSSEAIAERRRLSPNAVFAAAAESWRSTPELLGRVEAFARRERATVYEVCLTGFVALLARRSQQSDLTIGTQHQNRDAAGCEALIGLFAQALMVRVDGSGEPPFATLLERVRRTLKEARARGDVFGPFLQASRFRVNFNFLPEVADGGGAPLKLELEPAGHTMITWNDLTLLAGPRAGALFCFLRYNAELWRPETIRDWLSQFAAILEAAVQA